VNDLIHPGGILGKAGACQENRQRESEKHDLVYRFLGVGTTPWVPQHVSNSELARRLGVHERVIRGMLDPQHATKAEKIQAALSALGKQMTVDVRDAA
jgi:hypothetical protein